MLARIDYFPINNRAISFAKNLKQPFKKPEGDSFLHSNQTPVQKEGIFQKLKNKLNSSLAQQKINELLLETLFTPAERTYKFHNTNTITQKEFIKELSKLDYHNVAQKYIYIIEEISSSRHVVPTFIKNILTTENVTPETLEALYNLSQTANSCGGGGSHVYHIEMMVYYLNHYNNFDTLSTKNQYDYINQLEHYFDAEDISKLDKNSDLMRFDLIKDIKALGSIELMKEKLTDIAKNSPVSYIPVDESLAKSFIEDDIFSYENLINSIGEMNLNRYRKGIPLKYSREQFIADFKRGIQELNKNEKKKVFEYFQFSIDDTNDIIKYPVPNNSYSGYSSRIQNAILSLRKPVEDFMLNNEIRLDREDREAQDILNKFIKVFPEFISVIGKIQHRGDSIDFHTLDDLQRCLSNSEIMELSKNEQNILFLAIMFHDIAKKQGVVDRGHQKPSAYYAKEIIKKVPISVEEKERIYNLILNSHWTTDNNSIYDTALNFRFNNDFKMAQILAEADGSSAGFAFPVAEEELEDIQNCINRINSTGIPLFADNLPNDKSKIPTNDEGIMYLDFTDENADLSQFGFQKGTTVKDLNFLCHNSAGTIQEVADLCDDSKEICLSAEYKNAANKGIVTKYNAGYSGNCHIILHNTNENIAAGGIDVTCTGGKKGYREFKNYCYTNYFQEPTDNFQKRLITARRVEIPDLIKQSMELNHDEYTEFFNKINQFETKEDIQDITLASGRILRAKDITDCISKIQNTLTANKSRESYANEIIMFRPKTEAIIMGKQDFFKTPVEQSEIKQTAKKNNIPIILV